MCHRRKFAISSNKSQEFRPCLASDMAFFVSNQGETMAVRNKIVAVCVEPRFHEWLAHQAWRSRLSVSELIRRVLTPEAVAQAAHQATPDEQAA